MWRSKARGLVLLSSMRRPSPIQTEVPLEALTLVLGRSRCSPPPISIFQSTRLLASAREAWSGDLDDTNARFNPQESLDSHAVESQSLDFADRLDKNGEVGEDQTGVLSESGSSLDFEEGNARNVDFGESPIGGASVESLSSLWEETNNGDGSLGAFKLEGWVEGAGDEIPEIDDEDVESVRSLLQSTLQEPLESSLDVMGLTLSEEFVVRVMQNSNVSGENLIGFFKWAMKNDESVKTSRAVELLACKVGGSLDLGKKEAYMLWDLVKEIGEQRGLIGTEILNKLIEMFSKMGKAKAGLEVLEKFDDFGCSPNVNGYYFAIEALGKRSMFDTAWSVCEKMLNTGSLPESEKMGRIVTLLCKGKKLREAQSVYLVAKENKLQLPTSSLDSLIGELAKNDETVCIALELLDDYPQESQRYANKSFASVVQGLCRIGDLQAAKKLLLRMVELGPPPGNAAFNYVITALAKGGEVEDAIALMNVMDRRGLRPDVYAYTVIMSGFAKGGLIDEAYNIFSEAKKRHSKLSPVTYHILIRGYCKLEQFDKALECLKEMKEDGLQPNSDEYDKMIQSLCMKALDWRTAEKLQEEMKESGLYLKGITRSLIAAVKGLEEEEVQSTEVAIEA